MATKLDPPGRRVFCFSTARGASTGAEPGLRMRCSCWRRGHRCPWCRSWKKREKSQWRWLNNGLYLI
jgi:hypothetical protein